MADKEAASTKLDVSLLRTPIQISGKPIEQVLNSIHYGSPELRCLLMDECDLIFECKVCRALFRDLPNFISHKRAYCTKSALETRHVTIANLPEEKVVVIQPQGPEESHNVLPSTSQPLKSVRPNLEQTIMRIQSGELGRSHAYKVYTEAAEKLQRQKEGMKVATIRTTAIATNKNAVFIDVNMASVNIHERQQQVNNGIVPPYDQKRSENSVTVIKRKTGERPSNTRNVRKSAKQEKPSSEPQKLLMEQLKEIQHKVKQKVAAAHDKTTQQKKPRNVAHNTGSQKDASPAPTESSQKVLANTNTTRAQKKLADSSGLKVLSTDNVQSAVANDEETKGNAKDESDPEEVKYALVKQKVDGKIRSKAAKENKLLTAIAVTAATRRKKLAKRVPVCSKCNSVFATTKSLHFHERIHHSPKRTFYPCPYCSSVFYYFFGITRHLFRNHSKSLDEINAMRRQLRERSFTKPQTPPLCTKEVGGSTPGSGRSTRSLGRSQLFHLSQDTPSPAETSMANDKQLSKKTSGDGSDTIPEVSSKIARHKLAQANATQEEHTTSPQSSGSRTSDKTDDAANAKEDKGEARPIRLKNRQQPKAGENTVKSSSANNLIGASTAVNTTLPSSPIISRSQDNMSHLCPKCHRAFRRKISCKNHIKVCKAKGSSAQKTVRTRNTRHNSQPESLASGNSNKHTKMKNRNKTSSFDCTEKFMVTSDSESTTPVKVLEMKDENVVIFQEESNDRKTSLRNSQVFSVDRTNSLTQRSSSVDRVVTNDEPRNRSRERNSAARDERDSSVESTQSNMESKSPRSRRNVLSRFAAPAQLPTSPCKQDPPVKSDVSNASYSKFSDGQQADVGENSSEVGDAFLHNGKDKASEDDIEVNIKSESTPTEASVRRNLSTPARAVKTRPSTFRDAVGKSVHDPAPDIQHPTDNDIKVDEDINHAATLSQIPPLASVMSNKSPEKQEDSPLKSQCSPYKPSTKKSLPSAHKLPADADRSGLLSDMSLDSCKPEVLSVHENSCHDVVSGSAVASEVPSVQGDSCHNVVSGSAVASEMPSVQGDSCHDVVSGSAVASEVLSVQEDSCHDVVSGNVISSEVLPVQQNSCHDVVSARAVASEVLSVQHDTCNDVASVNSNKPTKMNNRNKTSSFDSTEKFMTTSGTEWISPVKGPENKDENGDIFQEESSDSCRDAVSGSTTAAEMVNTGDDKPEADLDTTVTKTEEMKLDAMDSDSKPDIKTDVIINAEDKCGVAASDHKPTQNNLTMQPGLQLDGADSDRKCTDNDLNIQQRVKLCIPDYKQQTSESFQKMKPTAQNHEEEKLPEILQIDSGCKTLDSAVQEDKTPRFKKSEVSSKKLPVSEVNKNPGSSGNVKNMSGNSKNKDIKPHNLPSVAVISALSERPKRKRKVPSRNKDAEEMLSKIHNHNREVAPVKKTRLTQEIKASESPKKKLKAENIKIETLTAAELDKNCQRINDEPESHAKKRKLYLKDASSEVEQADDDSDEAFGKAKGRFVSNRLYVLEKCGSKNKRLKCYDQMKVYRMIDEDQLKCLECGESCSQMCNLRRHVIRQHLKWSRFKCKLCKFESYDRSECATHLIRGHKNRTISLRTVNQFILDLVKKGSHARSLKKTETIKVKQQSESQEGNIYARPTVKKTLRLPQKAEEETTSRATMGESSGNRDIKNTNGQPHVWTIEELLPTSNPADGTSSLVTVSKKQTNSLTSSPKAETHSKQPTQQQVSSKGGIEAAGKATRKTLPFNISTRNSPRTFDTRPYAPASDDAPTETEAGASGQKFQPITGRANIHEEIVLPSGKLTQKPGARNNASLQKDAQKPGSGFVSTALVETSSTDSVQKSRNIFENINTHTTYSLPVAVSSTVTTSTTASKAATSSSRELNISTSILNRSPSPRIIEVKVESPKNIVSVSSSQVLNQKLDPSNKKATGVKIEKSKVVSYVFRGPQLSVPNASSDTVNSDQLPKSLIKFGDQVSLPGASLPPSQQITKITLPPGKFSTAQVIDSANLQRKHASIPASSSGTSKMTPVDNLKVTQRSAGTSKETAGSSSSLSLAAALTKGGHIFTTVATSFIVSHGQAGKFIVYTRPAGAKDSTTVSSVTRQSPVTSPLSLAPSAVATDSKNSDASVQRDSQGQGAVAEDVLPPGTFVIRKHYL